VLANVLKTEPVEMGWEEIADLEDLTVEEVKAIYDAAVVSYRKKVLKNNDED